jgi:excisionase family DNA binding protein
MTKKAEKKQGKQKEGQVNLWASMTPEQKKARTDKMQAGKAKKEAERKAALNIGNDTGKTAKEIIDEINIERETPVSATDDGLPTLNLDNITEVDLTEAPTTAPEEHIDSEASFMAADPFYEGLKASKAGDRHRLPYYPTVREAARSSVEGAVLAADPERVAELTAALGRFYSVEDVAAALGITTRTVLQKLRDGKLEGVKLGNNWKISLTALKKFMNVD